jgi:hypothetical protein
LLTVCLQGEQALLTIGYCLYSQRPLGGQGDAGIFSLKAELVPTVCWLAVFLALTYEGANNFHKKWQYGARAIAATCLASFEL